MTSINKTYNCWINWIARTLIINPRTRSTSWINLPFAYKSKRYKTIIVIPPSRIWRKKMCTVFVIIDIIRFWSSPISIIQTRAVTPYISTIVLIIAESYPQKMPGKTVGKKFGFLFTVSRLHRLIQITIVCIKARGILRYGWHYCIYLGSVWKTQITSLEIPHVT